MSYAEKLRDPRWQKKRLEILERDGWCCQQCHDIESTLMVHHMGYLGDNDPWDHPNEALLTLCEECHEREREIRPDVENHLLEALRTIFLADDIENLTEGLELLELCHMSYIVASAYSLAFASPLIQQELIEKYFEGCREVGRQKAIQQREAKDGEATD